MRESLRFLSAARGGTLWCDFDIDPTFFQGFLQLASQPAVCDQSVDIRQFGEGDKGILTNLIAAAEDDHLVGYGEHGFLDFRLPHVRGHGTAGCGKAVGAHKCLVHHKMAEGLRTEIAHRTVVIIPMAPPEK